MGVFKAIATGVGKFAKSALGQTFLPAGTQLIADTITANRQRKFANEAWEKQNAYNSPVQQLARYREAGMNPAYGAGMASGNADKMSDAATSVAKVEVPNLLTSLGQYQSLKNAVLEGDRIKALTEQELIKNAFLNESFVFRLAEANLKPQILEYKTRKEGYDSLALERFYTNIDGTDSNRNPYLMKYQLDSQRLNQNSQMFDIDLALKKIGWVS